MSEHPTSAGGQAIGSRTVAPPRVRPLHELVAELSGIEIRGDARTPISGLGFRSAEAASGSLFFCVPGSRADGHVFAPVAAERGAVALVVERWLPLELVQVRVASVR